MCFCVLSFFVVSCSVVWYRVLLCCNAVNPQHYTVSDRLVSDLLYRTGVITLTCETEVPGEKPDAVPLCPRQISQFTGFEPDPLA